MPTDETRDRDLWWGGAGAEGESLTTHVDWFLTLTLTHSEVGLANHVRVRPQSSTGRDNGPRASGVVSGPLSSLTLFGWFQTPGVTGLVRFSDSRNLFGNLLRNRFPLGDGPKVPRSGETGSSFKGWGTRNGRNDGWCK